MANPDKLELQKNAAYMIYRLKLGKSKRMDITDAIEALPGEQQEEFKQYLNYYKRLIWMYLQRLTATQVDKQLYT